MITKQTRSQSAAGDPYDNLRNIMDGYSKISDATWCAFKALCTVKSLPKHATLYQDGDIPKTFSFIEQGLMRCFVTDEKGTEYNKNFFKEYQFPGSMTALLTNTPSALSFQALEPTRLVEIDFVGYRKLLMTSDDLKLFQIFYLEQNWVLNKDSRDTEIVLEDATSRYVRFINTQFELANRLSQYHIASHLGITPTQLSRIRKKL